MTISKTKPQNNGKFVLWRSFMLRVEGCCSLGFLNEDFVIINFWRSHTTWLGIIKFWISIVAETPILGTCFREAQPNLVGIAMLLVTSEYREVECPRVDLLTKIWYLYCIYIKFNNSSKWKKIDNGMSIKLSEIWECRTLELYYV